jgi:chemotaxis protein CheD
MAAGVRMGEMIVSTDPTVELVALGLGSCIGLAIIDRSAGVAGLAHIVLPESHDAAAPGKFADTAVPLMLQKLKRAGAVERRMEIVMVGGARMFEMSGGLDIGSRNEQAVHAALAKLRLRARFVQTGGNQGRTLKVAVATGHVTVRVAGQAALTLLEAKRTTTVPAAASHLRAATASAGASRGVRIIAAIGGAAS